MRDLTDLRAAVVGTGFIGVVHVDALRRLGVQVLGVVGSSPERARAKSGPVPLPEPYESEEMLADDRIDVVHLTTANQLHYRQARAALEAGRHVVCEKPLAIDLRERRWVEVPA
jgi:predicted dehydrogenase